VYERLRYTSIARGSCVNASRRGEFAIARHHAMATATGVNVLNEDLKSQPGLSGHRHQLSGTMEHRWFLNNGVNVLNQGLQRSC
jgi:pSer/pThr/pTyr-binding forkhead associated (FHA) protein